MLTETSDVAMIDISDDSEKEGELEGEPPVSASLRPRSHTAFPAFSPYTPTTSNDVFSSRRTASVSGEGGGGEWGGGGEGGGEEGEGRVRLGAVFRL